MEETVVEETKQETVEVEQDFKVFDESDNPLDDIFGDDPLAEKGEVAPEPPSTEEDKGEIVAETPAAVKEEPAPIVPVVESEEVRGLKAALAAERNKRQELQQKPPEPKEFDWTNPQKTIESVADDLRAEFQTNFLTMSEAQCKSRHEDYTDKYNVFVAMAQENPALVNTVVQQPDPAEYAYNLAKQKMFTDEVGSDPTAYEDKLRAKITAEVEAKYKTNVQGKADLAASLPPSAKSIGDKVPPRDAVDADPLDELFPGEVPS